MIYLDNAATTHKKPPQVANAVYNYLKNISASPGRSAHKLAIEAGRIVVDAREALAQLFNIKDPARIVFTHNATYAINIALFGLLRRGDHIVTTSLEHNAVMRPLNLLKKKLDLDVTVVGADADGTLPPHRILNAVRPNTRLVVVNHASNVVGTVIDLSELGQQLRSRGVVLLVDAAQTAGAVPIDVERDAIALLAFTGHKALFGPPGTGGLYVAPWVQLQPAICGGTGSRSEHEQQPDFLPDMLEAGTPNTAGIAGLNAGVRFILEDGLERIRSYEKELTGRLLEGLARIDAVTVYGPREPSRQTAVVSVNVDGKTPSEVGALLDERYDIAVRVGLHCAPSAHRTITTFPNGTVRISLSYLNQKDEVDAVVDALAEIAKDG